MTQGEDRQKVIDETLKNLEKVDITLPSERVISFIDKVFESIEIAKGKNK